MSTAVQVEQPASAPPPPTAAAGRPARSASRSRASRTRAVVGVFAGVGV